MVSVVFARLRFFQFTENFLKRGLTQVLFALGLKFELALGAFLRDVAVLFESGQIFPGRRLLPGRLFSIYISKLKHISEIHGLMINWFYVWLSLLEIQSTPRQSRQRLRKSAESIHAASFDYVGQCFRSIAMAD